MNNGKHKIDPRLLAAAQSGQIIGEPKALASATVHILDNNTIRVEYTCEEQRAALAFLEASRALFVRRWEAEQRKAELERKPIIETGA